MYTNFNTILEESNIDISHIIHNPSLASKFIYRCPNHIFMHFIENVRNINYIHPETGYSFLSYCCVYLNNLKLSYLLQIEDLHISINTPCKYFGYNLVDKKIVPANSDIEVLEFYKIYPIHFMALYGSYDNIFKILNKTDDNVLKTDIIIRYKKIGKGYMTTEANIYDLLYYRQNITNDEYQNLINNINIRISQEKLSFGKKILNYLDIKHIRFEDIFSIVYYTNYDGRRTRRQRF